LVLCTLVSTEIYDVWDSIVVAAESECRAANVGCYGAVITVANYAACCSTTVAPGAVAATADEVLAALLPNRKTTRWRFSRKTIDAGTAAGAVAATALVAPLAVLAVALTPRRVGTSHPTDA
jgi:hypothetical protein